MLKNIDVLKYVMSILVIMIHVGWSYDIPYLRMAVPVFFILSSFLFFSRLPNDEAEAKKNLRKFLRRACFLYFFWFIVLLPTTIIIRHWYGLSAGELIEKVSLGILLKSTFPASWYISAYIIGIFITFMLRRHELILVITGVLSFLLCCLTSNYYYLLDYIPYGELLQRLTDSYEMYNSFPMGLLYIYTGIKIKRCLNVRISCVIVTVLIATVLLYLENNIIEFYNLRKANDAFLSLAILAPAIVVLALRLSSVKITEATALCLRKMSTIYYCSHLTILIMLRHIAKGLDEFLYFIIVLALCTILSAAIFGLQKVKKFNRLKYSY